MSGWQGRAVRTKWRDKGATPAGTGSPPVDPCDTTAIEQAEPAGCEGDAPGPTARRSGTCPVVKHTVGHARHLAIALPRASCGGQAVPFVTRLSRPAPGWWRPRNARGGTIGGTERRLP
jgi:hypothetical protein